VAASDRKVGPEGLLDVIFVLMPEAHALEERQLAEGTRRPLASRCRWFLPTCYIGETGWEAAARYAELYQEEQGEIPLSLKP